MPTLRAVPDNHAIIASASVLRALGHPLRLRLVDALERGECCVSELQETLGVAQALVSQQLARLRAAGVVSCRRDGTRMCYTVADDRVRHVLASFRLGNRSPRRRRSQQ